MSHDGLIHPAKDCAEQIAALEARIARLTHPAIYTGTHYANADVPAICPDCDSRDFISHGVTSVICRNCWLTAELDKAEAQVKTAQDLAADNFDVIQELRIQKVILEKQNRALREALLRLAHAVFGSHDASEPDVYADYDKLCELKAAVDDALAATETKA